MIAMLRRNRTCVSRTCVSGFLAAAMFVTSVPIGVARAELVTTDRVVDRAVAESERARISAFLARDDVRGRVVGMGVPLDEAERRVASMSDAEVLQVAGEIGDLPAGQAPGTSIVLVLLLVIILILVI